MEGPSDPKIATDIKTLSPLSDLDLSTFKMIFFLSTSTQLNLADRRERFLEIRVSNFGPQYKTGVKNWPKLTKNTRENHNQWEI